MFSPFFDWSIFLSLQLFLVDSMENNTCTTLAKYYPIYRHRSTQHQPLKIAPYYSEFTAQSVIKHSEMWLGDRQLSPTYWCAECDKAHEILRVCYVIIKQNKGINISKVICFFTYFNINTVIT